MKMQEKISSADYVTAESRGDGSKYRHVEPTDLHTDTPLSKYWDKDFQLFDDIQSGVFGKDADTYIPYNTIVKDNYNYTIEVALAGFKSEDFDVYLTGAYIRIMSKTQNNKSKAQRIITDFATDSETNYPFYLHKGIAQRSFSLRFRIPNNVVVDNPVFENGLLTIDIKKSVTSSPPGMCDTLTPMNIILK